MFDEINGKIDGSRRMFHNNKMIDEVVVLLVIAHFTCHGPWFDQISVNMFNKTPETWKIDDETEKREGT